MGMISWIKSKFIYKDELTQGYFDDAQKCADEIAVRKLAFSIVENQIADTLSKCEFKTYRKGEEEKSDLWYRLNKKPNANQNKAEFWNEFINYLYDHNEALIVTLNGQLFVANDYVHNDDSTLMDHTFSGVRIGKLNLEKTFKMGEVYFFRLNNKHIYQLLKDATSSYKKLIALAENAYTSANGRKGKLKIDQIAINDKNFSDKLNNLLQNDFKNYFQSANAVLPLTRGYDYEELPSSGQMVSRDYRALIDDIFEITARAFRFPRAILNGDVQDTSKAIDQLLMFVIDPLANLIQEEISIKEYSEKEIMQGGNYVKVDTSSIKHIDVLDQSANIEKVISCGFSCVNDVNKLLGLPEIEEDWANQHFITKNFALMDDVFNAMKGGDSDEKGNDATT